MASLFALAAAAHLFAGPQVMASSGIVVDEATGKVLWARAENELRYPASTTKILTAMLLIERTLPTEKVKAPAGVDKIEPSSMNLKPGEVLTAKDLLYGLMLRSANDGCVAVAHHISGSVEQFAELMNTRAAELGAMNTRFTNPNGLPDPNHVTTAYDLAAISRAAMKYPLFREVVRTKKVRIQRSINQKDLWMVNRNKRLFKDPSADGIKTGYTKASGSTYVGSVTREGFRVITVLLDTEKWQEDQSQMVAWTYKAFDRRLVAKAGQSVGEVAIRGLAKPVPVMLGKGLYEVVRPNTADGSWKIDAIEVSGPVVYKQHVADAQYTDADGFTQTFPVYAAEAVPEETLKGSPLFGGTLWTGLGLAGLWFFQYRRRRRFFRPDVSYAQTQRRRP